MSVIPEKFSLLTQWYAPPQNSRRQEIISALKHNCDNPLIEKIILLNEKMYDLPFTSEKIVQIILGKRLTFGNAYDYARTFGKKGEAWCLANADIAFDKSLGDVYFNSENEVHCLTRYDLVNGSWELFGGNQTPRADSQDSWLFLTPQFSLKTDPFTGLSAHQLEIGQLGFDNKIALLLYASGFYCKNSCRTITTYHYHLQRDFNSDKQRESKRYPCPYLLLDPIEIHEEAKMRLDIFFKISILSTNSREQFIRVSTPIKYGDQLENLKLVVQGSFDK